MTFVDVIQLSNDWLKMRVGCVSASQVHKVMATVKDPKKQAAPRLNYRKRLVMEMLTGLTAETYVSPYMQSGLEVEPLARAAYEMERDVEVLHGGLFIHDSIPRFVASPDGRIGPDGLLEIKYLTGVTTEANHLDLLMGAEIPDEYQKQMLAQMACSGRKWVDFVSYQPAPMPKKLRMHIRRFPRDEKRIAEMEQAVEKFLAEVDEMLERLKQDDPNSLAGALARSVEALGQGLAG